MEAQDHNDAELSESTNHSGDEEIKEDFLVPLEQISLQTLEEKDGVPSKVRIRYINNDVFEGEVDPQGQKEGWGVYLYGNNEKYEGFWQSNKIHGYGKYYFRGGEFYEGDWYEGRKEGLGILKFGEGERYEGEFYRDEFDGKGIMSYANGDKFEGEWKGGKKNGQGTFSGKDRRIVGEWIDDELQHF